MIANPIAIKKRKTTSGSIQVQGVAHDTHGCTSTVSAGTTGCSHLIGDNVHTIVRMQWGGWSGSNRSYIGKFKEFRLGYKYFTLQARGSQELKHIIKGLKYITSQLEEQMEKNRLSCTCTPLDIEADIKTERAQELITEMQDEFEGVATPLADDVLEEGSEADL